MTHPPHPPPARPFPFSAVDAEVEERKAAAVDAIRRYLAVKVPNAGTDPHKAGLRVSEGFHVLREAVDAMAGFAYFVARDVQREVVEMTSASIGPRTIADFQCPHDVLAEAPRVLQHATAVMATRACHAAVCRQKRTKGPRA
jgi:hypothetical protein